jgi:nitrite reductase/ring-hydroxylating ferredoxin subunit
MAFRRVARLSEVPSGGGIRVRVDDHLIGLYRLGDRLYAMDDVCPHAGYPLHAGRLEGTRVVCAGHGWEFDLITGLAPGEEDEEPLVRYPVHVAGEEVFVDVDDPIERSPAEGAALG